MVAEALSGIRVLDLTSLIAGPYCTKLLAELGAEVLKIENPEGGDETRSLGPFPQDLPHPEKSGLFLYLNTRKKGLTLNLATELGRKTLRALTQKADVLVESFTPGVMANWGLDYQSLAQDNPGLVMTSISNFGQNGPYARYKASDMTIEALAGIMFITGFPDRAPLKLAGNQFQYIAGLEAATGTLAALCARDLLQQGQHVDISIFESALHMLDFTPAWYIHEGRIRTRIGSRHAHHGPFAVLPCKDGYVAFSGSRPPDWENLCKLIGRPDLLKDPRLDTPEKRGLAADEVEGYLRPWFREHTRQELVETLQKLKIPTGPILDVSELFADPQNKWRQFFAEIDHPVAGRLPYPDLPMKLSETPSQTGRAPLLGEHNEAIYGGELGYSREELVRLRQKGVL